MNTLPFAINSDFLLLSSWQKNEGTPATATFIGTNWRELIGNFIDSALKSFSRGWALPALWKLGSPLVTRVYWISGTPAAHTDDVEWVIGAYGVKNNETLAVALTNNNNFDLSSADTRLYISDPVSLNVGSSGSLARGDYLELRVRRNNNGQAGTVSMLGLKVTYQLTNPFESF
jgi:hypothetical protein